MLLFKSRDVSDAGEVERDTGHSRQKKGWLSPVALGLLGRGLFGATEVLAYQPATDLGRVSFLRGHFKALHELQRLQA